MLGDKYNYGETTQAGAEGFTDSCFTLELPLRYLNTIKKAIQNLNGFNGFVVKEQEEHCELVITANQPFPEATFKQLKQELANTAILVVEQKNSMSSSSQCAQTNATSQFYTDQKSTISNPSPTSQTNTLAALGVEGKEEKQPKQLVTRKKLLIFSAGQVLNK